MITTLLLLLSPLFTANNGQHAATLNLDAIEIRLNIDQPRHIMYDTDYEMISVVCHPYDNGKAETIKGGILTGWGKRSFWNCYPKRHFLLSFDTPRKLAGLPEGSRFMLVPSYPDRTQMRNELAWRISETIGLDYTPYRNYVNLYLNGYYWGLYQVVEYLASGPGRMDNCESRFMFDVGNGGRDRISTADGYPTEGTEKAWDREDYAHFRTAVKGYPVIMRSGSKGEAERIINEFEKALYKGGRYLTTIDLESFAKYYILEEITKDMEGITEPWQYHPGYNMNFRSNGHPKYIYGYIKDGKIGMGPGWMFEYGTFAQNGSINTRLYPYMNSGMYYPELLLRHTSLLTQCKSIWKKKNLSSKLKPAVFNSWIDEIAATILPSVVADNERWNITDDNNSALIKNTNNTNQDCNLSFSEAIKRMKDKYEVLYDSMRTLLE